MDNDLKGFKIRDYISANSHAIHVSSKTAAVFSVDYVNCYDDIDCEEPTDYQDGERLNFFSRLDRAIAELEDDTKGMTTNKEVLKHYKENTEEGNSNYYGNFLCVFTNTDDDSVISIGVRMD